MTLRGVIHAAVAALLSAAIVTGSMLPGLAQTGTATLSGLVADQRNALPVPGAEVQLVVHAGAVVASTTTGGDGRFRITGVVSGIYDLIVRARGYDTFADDLVAIADATQSTFDVTLAQAETSTPGTLSTIGRVATSANRLQAATTITQTISTEDVTRTGQIRSSDMLATLPGVNFSTSSSVGDDASISLRGFGSDESAMLLDGHPVGPLGVGSGGFNFSLGPAFGLSSINVTYGSGAQGLYGNDTIGGAVNFVTLSPTTQPHATFQQQVGGFGITSTGITATGTLNRLGYAFAAGRLGEYGDFAAGPTPQSARPNNVVAGSASPPSVCDQSPNDVSACNLALNTYTVSQNTYQGIGLGKLVYSFSPVTKLEATAYDAVQWSDSTGNGDNDYLPYSVRLGQVTKAPTNCTTSGGVAGYTVTTDPVAGSTACYTAQQFASATYGPDGGGAGRDRSTRMGDYHLRFTTQPSSTNTITIDGYINNYVYWKNSSEAGGIDATGNFLGTPTFANFYNTFGYLVSDEFMVGPHDIAFGYDGWHQLQTGNEIDASGITLNPALFFGEWSAFARDTYTITDRLSAFINAWVKHSSVSLKSTFDPRATLQFRPSANDVVQVTYGRSDGAPSPSLLQTGVPIASDPGASLTSVNCTGFNDVTSAGNPNLLSESANDYEFGYGHRFSGDSNVQVNAYVTHVTDQLFGASEPLAQYGIGNVVFAPGALTTYINRLNSQCGLNLNNATVLQYLSVGTTFNAASALARGIELSGRQRIAPWAYIDYSYDIESSAHVGIDDNILMNNPTVVNGAQLSGIPIHQASVSLDVARNGWEFRIDNYYMGFNNPLNRPAYWHSNAFITRTLNHGRTLLTLGGTNIFNNAVQDYGYLGLGTIPIVNQFAAPANASEEFGIAPAQLTFTLQERI